MQQPPGMMDSVIVPVHKAGWPFIAIFAVGSVVLFVFSDFLGWIGTILTLWCVYFFRDPPRVTPSRDGLVVSPADGLVHSVVEGPAPKELEMGDEKVWRVSIFLSVFDVHVNRSPISGRVTKAVYRPGKFVNAALDKASEDNERQSLRIEADPGKRIAVVQIAGLIARRIICDVREGDRIDAGERYGLIRFGSRVDLYLPAGVQPLVVVGQRATGGETVIADLHSGEPRRMGEVR